jgi:GNAT superfamily N-acetyltransferase
MKTRKVNNSSMYGTFGNHQTKEPLDPITFTSTYNRVLIRALIKDHLYIKRKWLLYQFYQFILSSWPSLLKDCNVNLIVAWYKNDPVGVLTLMGWNFRESNLYVVPKYRRLGIATQLLSEAYSQNFISQDNLLGFTGFDNVALGSLSKKFPNIRKFAYTRENLDGNVVCRRKVYLTPKDIPTLESYFPNGAVVTSGCGGVNLLEHLVNSNMGEVNGDQNCTTEEKDYPFRSD